MSDPAITTKATRSWWSTIVKRSRSRRDRRGMGAKKRRYRDCSDWRTWKSCRASASSGRIGLRWAADPSLRAMSASQWDGYEGAVGADRRRFARGPRSEEHTSELQSRGHLVCRLLLEKKKTEDKGQTEGVAVAVTIQPRRERSRRG